MNQAIQAALHGEDGNPALLDTATGALSRAAFVLRLEETIALGQRLEHAISMVVVELCRPRALREAYGDAAADLMLAELVDRIWAPARSSDTVARISPTRLVVLLPATDAADVIRYVARMTPLLEGPCPIGKGKVPARFSLTTISIAPSDDTDSSALLAQMEQRDRVMPA